MENLINRALALIDLKANSAVFITSLLRPREIKMAVALRGEGWNVILLYKKTTPFDPENYFDVAIRIDDDREIHRIATALRAPIYHLFSGAVDELTLNLCRNKPGRLIIDLNDVFCPNLFNYLHERFAPTKECLELADAICCRDLQPKFAERFDNFSLPKHVLLFQEYSWTNGPANPMASKKRNPDELHVVSVGTFTVKSHGMSDSSYTTLAELFTEKKIHLHIYPHWFYRKSAGSAFNFNVATDLGEYLEMEKRTPYVHVHDSLPLAELARELPQYDFGIISGGSADLGQTLNFLTKNYMEACYSGRISDYLDARLPVLINKEVSFNYWLLDRLSVAVDLGKIFSADFREKLLSIRHDPHQVEKTSRAAERMSLRRHAVRLSQFYSSIIRKIPSRNIAAPRWLNFMQRVPLVGRGVRDFTTFTKRELDRQRQRLDEQSRVIKTLKKNIAASGRSQLIELIEENTRLKEQTAALEAQAGQLRHEVKIESISVNEIAGLLNWPAIADDFDRNNGFFELVKMAAISDDSGNGDISSAWKLLNRKNFDQLLKYGYENFKRTIALNYFTFPVQAGDPQTSFLEENLSAEEVHSCRLIADSLPREAGLMPENQAEYRYFVLLIWLYAKARDALGLLRQVSEPAEGNPIVVPFGQDMASQDLANSALEYYSIQEGVELAQCESVLEVGGGYGRNAHMILSLHPTVRYVMVDIPPALYVAQRYLSSLFRNRRIFHAREFSSYDEVRSEIEEASIVFLLPNQLKLIPNKTFQLTINISSFGEMNRGQIDRYFNEIDRITAGAFYSKQWKKSQNPFDKLILSEGDYPIRPHWNKVYSRSCPVQSEFFESLYLVNAEKAK
jgi:putative sugar O-methyltransferase